MKLLLFFLLLTLAFVKAHSLVDGTLLPQMVAAGFWLSFCLLIHALLTVTIWRGLLPRWTGNRAPMLLEQMSAMLLVVIAIGIILVRVYELPLSGVMTTSSVFIAIVGFALRNMISDLFTGIALGIERPFSVNDWIQTSDGTIGRVVEMNWRSTRLLTREEISVVIPNSELAISTFRNFSKPQRAWRDEFEILLHQNVTAWQAERILLSAVNQVPELVAVDKPPEVRIARYTENGIEWQVRYWVPDYPQMSRLRYEVQKAISRNMHFAGVSIPPKQVFHADSSLQRTDNSFDLLTRLELFQSLSADEIMQIQAVLREKLVLRNQAVVTQGEAGDSLFIVKEGLLQVSFQEQGQTVILAHIVPGSFFGEMSLLTGDPRHATVTARVDSVVLEINKSEFEPIIQSRPQIASLLSDTLSRRQQDNDRRALSRSEGAEESRENLLLRIRNFFSITGNGERE